MGATSRNPSRRPARHGSGVGRCSAARGGPWLGHPSPVNDWYWLESGIDFYSPGGFVAIDHRHLDIHEDEVGVLRPSLGDTGLAICGLDDRVTRASEEVAKQPAQGFLLLYDKNAVAHESL